MHPARHNSAVHWPMRITLACLLMLALVVTCPVPVLAQGCAMCRTVLPQANDPLARGFFWSFVVLVSAPFVVGASIGGWLFYQYRGARRMQQPTAAVVSLPLTHGQKEDQL
jgi:hypothetical protein